MSATPSAAAAADASARRYAKSAKAFAAARRVMPGGVSSPVRAYRSVDRDPVFVASGDGCRVTDVDGNAYIDYVMSYGPLILGHRPDVVRAAMSKTIKKGWTFGMPTPLETELAELVVESVPGIEVVRFVNSGTEAAMSAIRLARAFTGRSKVIKCTGCYHGHSDALLVEAGSGATTLGTPSSPGVPGSVTSETVLVPFNDLEAVRGVFEQMGGEIACMAVEPIAGNMGCIPPSKGYLQGLRELCDEHGAVLLFDEVMTGFRVGLGGAQRLYGVTPDVTCLGKVVGGGLPCAAYGAREEIMRMVSPDGPVYQAGTLSGNPLAMAAGAATLRELRDTDAYEQLERTGAQLSDGLRHAAAKAGCPVQVTRVGSMLGVFFSDTPVANYAQATACRTDRFTAFFGAMLDRGVMLAPSAYEAWFVSTAHQPADIDDTLTAAEAAFEAAAAID
ncbi:MAG: glutamate-1-semialdehyde 2,1-aminomutase [Planctomycetota bacterium]